MAKSKAEIRAEMAALTAGAKVTKVAEGATVGLSARDFYNASRGIVTASNRDFVKIDENALIAERHEVHGGIINGLGEWIYSDKGN